MSYTPFYCRHPTRRNDAKLGRADCRLVAESAGLRAAPNLLGRECLGPERISARVIEVGFSIVLIRRSGRPATSLDEGRALRLSCLGADSIHLSVTSFPPFAGFAALHYCDLSYKSLQSRSVSLSKLDRALRGCVPRLGRLRRCHLICRRASGGKRCSIVAAFRAVLCSAVSASSTGGRLP